MVSIGFLIVDKPQGLTSQAVVSRVKRALKVKKAGHTGTLDPLATGVLPLALGEATKIIPFLDETVKTYRVQGKLGAATDTFDSQGKITDEGKCASVIKENLESALKQFRGTQLQRPPIYSAIKVQGKPLYRYARQGKTIIPKKREINIKDIFLESFDLPFFELRVKCSRGTYIRSLIHDIGIKLGCFAHVSKLRRTGTGPFTEDVAVPWGDVENSPEVLPDKIISIEDCLGKLPAVNLLSKDEASRVKNGGKLPRVEQKLLEMDLKQQTVALKFEEKILALVQSDDGGPLAYQRVLNR